MKRSTLLLMLGAPALSGCVPMMAVSAVSMVGQAAAGHPTSNAGFGAQARDACTSEAARYGTVDVIDVEQHRVDQIIVWGTVDDARQKRSFECDYGTKIKAFKLRPIRAQL